MYRVIPCLLFPFLVVSLVLFISGTQASAAIEYSMEVTFDGYTKSTTLIDYPALVVLDENLEGFSYGTFASSAGDDLRFYDSGGNELNYEIESWNTSGTSHIWVQVPELATGSTIEARWGNPADTKPAYTSDGSTWTSGYLGVYHLNSGAADSTANSNDGAFTDDGDGNYVTSTAGAVAGGIDVLSGAHVNLGGSDGRWAAIDMDHNDRFTMSVWVNPDATNSDQTLIGRFGSQFLLWLDADGIENFVFYDNGGPRTPEGSGIGAQAREWQLVTATGDGTTLQLYVDGVLSGSSSGDYSLGSNADDISLGTTLGGNTGRALNGLLDEARIAAIVLSEDWIWADFQNQSAPLEFATYGRVVPEPCTCGMLAGLAILGLLMPRRRRHA